MGSNDKDTKKRWKILKFDARRRKGDRYGREEKDNG